MKILNSFEFTNNKSIEVRYYTDSEIKKLGLPKGDNICLTFKHKGKCDRVHMRPDEIAICLALLGDGLYKTIKAYRVGVKQSKQFNYEIR